MIHLSGSLAWVYINKVLKQINIGSISASVEPKLFTVPILNVAFMRDFLFRFETVERWTINAFDIFPFAKQFFLLSKWQIPIELLDGILMTAVSALRSAFEWKHSFCRSFWLIFCGMVFNQIHTIWNHIFLRHLLNVSIHHWNPLWIVTNVKCRAGWTFWIESEFNSKASMDLMPLINLK